jgi:hypothetical protein
MKKSSYVLLILIFMACAHRRPEETMPTWDFPKETCPIINESALSDKIYDILSQNPAIQEGKKLKIIKSVNKTILFKSPTLRYDVSIDLEKNLAQSGPYVNVPCRISSSCSTQIIDNQKTKHHYQSYVCSMTGKSVAEMLNLNKKYFNKCPESFWASIELDNNQLVSLEIRFPEEKCYCEKKSQEVIFKF